jgi:hypothetical protein
VAANMAKEVKKFRDFREGYDVYHFTGKFIRILADFIAFFPHFETAVHFRYFISMFTNVTD